MSEEDKSQSMSDKDRTMANRFGGEGKEDAPEKDDDDDEKDEKKDTKQPPKRALFLSNNKEDTAESSEKTEEQKPKRNLFSGLLKKDVEEAEKPDETQSAELPPEESDVTHEKTIEEPTGITVENIDPQPESAEQEATRAEFQEIVLDRIGEVEAELEELPAEEEPVEALASAAFLEHVGERLEEGVPPEVAIEDALENELDPPEADAAPEDLANVQNFDVETVEEDQDVVVPPTPTRRVTTPPPPSPPMPRVVPPYMPPPLRGPSSFNANLPSGGAISPNTIQNNPDIEQMNDYYYRKRRSGDLLLGGVVGYLLGKRRGRRATEAKFEPEIRKRDDAIGELKDKLITSEEKVRAIASAKSAEVAPNEIKVPNRAEKVEKPVVETRTEYVEVPVAETIEVPAVETIIQQIEALPVQTLAAEKSALAEQENIFAESLALPFVEAVKAVTNEQSEPEKLSELLNRSDVVEQLQAVKETAEKASVESVEKLETIVAPVATYERVSERRQPTVEKLSPPSVEVKKDPRSMTMPELLEVADHIFLEKTSVKELYEHNRIDAVNLRRVVLEYMNGGTRYEKVLRGSLEAVEMQRELRNEIRHDPAATFSAVDGQDNAAGHENTTAAQETSLSNADKLSTSYNPEGANQLKGSAEHESQDQLMLSNGTAIAVGVLMGIAIMIVLFLYAR